MKPNSVYNLFFVSVFIIGCSKSETTSNEETVQKKAETKLKFSESERINRIKTANRLFSFCEKYATEKDVDNFQKAANKILKLHPNSQEANILKEYAEICSTNNSQIHNIRKALERNRN